MKLIKKGAIAILGLQLLTVFTISGGIVNAETLNNTTKNTRKVVKQDQVKLSQNTIDDFDKYITIKNNSYILNSNVDTIFPEDEVSTVKDMLSSANEEIKKHHEIIDPSTKEIVNLNTSPFIVMAAYNKNYTTKAFWWGKRYYFTSNIAVNRGAKYFRHISSLRYNDSLFLSALGDSIAYASPYATLAANVASMGVGYVAGQYSAAATALVKYNNRHRHNQIYLDLNRTFQYSLHILK